ncbi:UNVERIFIED_CONTAM: hypothetical protein Sindi_1713500 [Sesamum indicum]
MTNSNNGGNNGSYKGNSSLTSTVRPTTPPTNPTFGAANVPIPNLAFEANAPTFDQTVRPIVMNPLFYEQLCQFIMEPSTQPSVILKLGEQDPFPNWREAGHQEVKATRHPDVNALVKKETMPAEHGIPFSEHIMVEELPTHFQAPSHLPTYDGKTYPTKQIRKFENAV